MHSHASVPLKDIETICDILCDDLELFLNDHEVDEHSTLQTTRQLSFKIHIYIRSSSYNVKKCTVYTSIISIPHILQCVFTISLLFSTIPLAHMYVHKIFQ